MKKNNLKFGMFFVIGILLVVSVGASSYSRSNPNYGLFNSYVTGNLNSSFQKCEAGQDFILQIAPLGCEPAVVRSDLLEEQNVPVFCQIAATKINPLIDVEAIEGITFSGQYSKDVSGVGFHPAKAALGVQGDLNSPVLNNIGYAVIVLKKQKNESAMPDFVQGNLTARLRYDIQNAFGIGTANFYLPQLKDSEWEEKKVQYSFWGGRGYLKAEEIETDRAVISIYSDRERIASVRLKKGETSDKISMPGFDCVANIQIKLDGLENSDTKAKLEINGDIIEVKKGEKFLENRCEIKKIEKNGLSERVEIYCREDESSSFFGGKTFSLKIEPKVSLAIEGVENSYSVGDKLPIIVGEKFLYLGYIGKSPTGVDYIIPVVSSAKTKESFLVSSAFSKVPAYVKNLKWNSNGNIEENSLKSVKSFFSGKDENGEWKLTGDAPVGFIFKSDPSKDSIAITGYSNPDEILKKIIFKELAGARDEKNLESAEVLDNYQKAIQDYDSIINGFGNIEYTNTGDYSVTYGEEAMIEKITLAKEVNQKKTMNDLCEDFKKKYANSKYSKAKDVLEKCNNIVELSNSEVTSASVLINGKVKDISFKGIYELKFDDYGAEVYFSGKNTNSQSGVRLAKGAIVQLGGDDFVELIEVKENSIVVKFNVKEKSGTSTNYKRYSGTNTEIKLDNYVSNVGDNEYKFGVTKINLNKLAKVSLIPNIDNAGTSANFSFKIGIEKRAIQLSPEKTRERIKNLDRTISEWEKKSENLGNIVKGLKGACLATGAVMVVKNFFENTGGKSIARQKVMRGEGGFYDICANEVSNKRFKSVEECLLEKSDDIDKAVESMDLLIQSQNNEIKNAQTGCDKKEFLTETHIDNDCFKENYWNNVKNELKTNLGSEIKCGETNVKVDETINKLNSKQFSTEDMRDIVLSSRAKKQDILSYQEKTSNKIFCDVYTNTKTEIEMSEFAKEVGFTNSDDTNFVLRKDAKPLQYKDKTYKDIKNKITIRTSLGDSPEPIDLNPQIADNTPISTILTSDGKKYVATLQKSGEQFAITKLYNLQGNPVNDSELTKSIYFKKYDDTSYKNEFKSSLGATEPQIRYYETAPYKGVPAVVPFDLKNGWYVSLKQTLPIGGGIAPVDKSGRVSSFYLCNVGKNNKEENRGGDDICEMVNLYTGQAYNLFPGITNTNEVTKLVSCGIEAVNDAQKQYSKNNYVLIDTPCARNLKIKVGSPAAEIPDMQCQDFMSPTDCQILFNVCDPVICPSSRCDFGGSYPVKDVIQSGIIGSIALCLPNWNKGIYIPVCLSGIKAGIDGLVSVYKSYRDCLQNSLDTGEMVGVCDEIHSIYLCEFFWKQALPIADLVIPKIMEMAFGQNVRGGGEYLGIASAWKTAENSVTYFTQYYAAASFKAFKARTAEEVGGEICKNFASGVYPEGRSVLDALTDPDSPPQFHGKFDEIHFTSTTIPPISQYKVFYHIYSGKDSRAYYQVYLTGGEQSSYYRDVSANYIVASGYIAKGGYASETKDFTAPTGYKKLCIRVNEQVECGFQQSSTSYAVNYISDKYIEEQATKSDITTEAECISGSASAYSLISPNLQSAGENLINPEIYNKGITRICATQSPGKGTDPLDGTTNARWVQVGYCDNKNMKCWIDKNNVKNVIKYAGIENQTLSELTKTNIELLQAESRFNTNQVGETLKEMKKGGKTPIEIIRKMNEIFSSVIIDNQKAELHLLRGNAYKELAKESSAKKIAENIVTTPTKTSSSVSSIMKEVSELESGEKNCKQQIGEKIIEIAREIKKASNKINDEDVNKDTGAKNFECLVLQVAMQESSLQHCKEESKDGDCLYCDGKSDEVFKSQLNEKSLGVMQINTEANKGKGDFSKFEENVKYGISYLIDKYSLGGKYYECNRKNYLGWNRALRFYNEWNIDCNKGNVNYVEEVLNQKGEVERMFAEVCGSATEGG